VNAPRQPAITRLAINQHSLTALYARLLDCAGIWGDHAPHHHHQPRYLNHLLRVTIAKSSSRSASSGVKPAPRRTNNPTNRNPIV
jgi:hypothetical protein